VTKDCSAEPRDSSGFDSGNVSDPIPKELLEYLHNSIGANLRSVAHYDRDTAVIETNDDLDDQPGEARVEEIIDDLRLQDVGRTRQENLYSVGALYCTIRAFDDALILHFIQGTHAAHSSPRPRDRSRTHRLHLRRAQHPAQPLRAGDIERTPWSADEE